MITKNQYCDYCGKQIIKDDKVQCAFDGFCIEIGYSVGGWGMRSNFINPESVEICHDCFVVVKEKVNELATTIKGLKKKNK